MASLASLSLSCRDGAGPAEVAGAFSRDDFRARGLKARKQLSEVIPAGAALPKEGGSGSLCAVFIGGDEVAQDKLALQAHNISHVLNATTSVANAFPDDFSYCRLPIHDSRVVDIRQDALPAAVDFITEARKEGTGVLVHCLWGVSRAPAMVLAYMVSCGKSLRSALEQISEARPAVQPNSAFVRQLIQYEQELRGSASLDLGEYKEACRSRDAVSSATLAALISPPLAQSKSGAKKARVVTVEGHRMFVERVSEAPRIAVIENFLTDEEADAAILAAKDSGRLHPSRTAPKKGSAGNAATQRDMPSLVSSGRTSSNCRFERTHPVGAAALQRATMLVGLTPAHAEALQVVHYDKSQRYNAHFDFFQEGLPGYEARIGTQGQRLVTCFVYLNDPTKGGCTYFPELDMRFRPRKGCAVLWYNMERDGSLDRKTLHAGEPVEAGEKWGMNIWLRERAKSAPAPAAQ